LFSLVTLGQRAVLFGQLKQHLGGRRLHSDEEEEVAIRESSGMPKCYFYVDGVSEVVSRYDIRSNLLLDYFKK
jgi:hypothetical protein